MILKLFFKIYHWLFNARTRIKLAYYKHLWKDQFSFDKLFVLSAYTTIDLQSGASSATFKKGVHFRNFCNVICGHNGKLLLGENVFFNNYCSVNCLHEITVGNNTIFGEGVKIYDHNHEFSDKDQLIIKQGIRYGSVNIGNNCWIGSNVVILANVNIGDNVVVGANNLIFKSIPANTIVMAAAEKHLKAY